MDRSLSAGGSNIPPAVLILSSRLKERGGDAFNTLRSAFLASDVDRSGSIDAAEFARICFRLGLPTTEEEVSGLVDAYDLDGNGRVDYAEFLSVS